MTTTEDLQDQLQNALNELDEVKEQNASLRQELGALSAELMQREDCLGAFLKERDTAINALRRVVALANDYRQECIGQANTFDRMLRSITE